MRLRSTLTALAAGVLAAVAAPAAAHAGSSTAVVTVIFEDNCDHTVTTTVANVTDKVGAFQYNNEPGHRTVPVYNTATKTPGTTVVSHGATFVNERGENVVRVRLLDGTKLGDGTHPAGVGVDRVVHGWAKPAGCNKPPAPAVHYDNCTDVWNKVGHPLHTGDPGYEAPRLDSDSDGTACETDPRPKGGTGGGEPSGDDGQEPTAEPTTPTVPERPVAVAQRVQAAQLPLTGPSAWWYVGGGLAALVIGVGLKRAGRRKRAHVQA